MKDFDVIVVGGGPAGSTSALECAKLGLRVLLVEKERRGRNKPCGGLLSQACVDAIQDRLRLKIPQSVTSFPETLGLHIIPPSGLKNAERFQACRFLNVRRALFDEWLLQSAEGGGALVWYNSRFMDFQEGERIKVLVMAEGREIELKTCFLIGADGVHSKVRRRLYPRSIMKKIRILQNHREFEGDIADFFCMVFAEKFSPFYSYFIPKDGSLIVGTGGHRSLDRLKRFEGLVEKEFGLKLGRLLKTEVGFIPFACEGIGLGRVILVGDAGGFCSTFSGEGIRFAIESGIAASQAIQDLLHEGGNLALAYANYCEWIVQYMQRNRQLAEDLSTDEKRENYVKRIRSSSLLLS